MKKIFLDELPHKGKYIDWKHSIGKTINFIYNEIKGKFKIYDYNVPTQTISILYSNNKYNIKTKMLLYNEIGGILQYKFCDSQYKFKINDIVPTATGEIQILEHIRIKSSKTNIKGYKYKCLKDKYVGIISEDHLIHNSGCPVCANKKVMIGINDMWTTNPELASLLNDSKDGYKYTYASKKKVDWKCPDCGNIIKNKCISNIYNRGLSCPRCSDGISFPEKFMYNLLIQLNVDFEYQKKFDWCKYEFKGKQKYGIYDFYLIDKQIIVEMDGGIGHGNRYTIGYTKEESKQIDDIKDQLAQKHNIEPIRVDCDYKNNVLPFDYIKQSLFKTKLNDYINLNKIDWNKININCHKSIIKEICNIKLNNPNITTSNMSILFKLSISTIIKYLKIGNKNNWCYYNPREEKRRSELIAHEHIRIKRSRKVICINTKKVYSSIAIAEKETNACNVSLCCSRVYKSAGKLPDGTKLVWMYYDEYIKKQGDNKNE